MPSQMYTSFSPGDLGDVEGCSYVRTAHPEHAGVSCDYIGLEVKKKKKIPSIQSMLWLALLHNYTRHMFHGVNDLDSLVCF